MPILTGSARVAGILGWPIAHSRSPRIHGFWLNKYGLDGAYVPLPLPPDRFEAGIRGLAAAGFAGVNITIPHKLAAFALCDSTDEAARRAGAVNTLVFRDGRIEGSNTDGFGFLEELHDHGIDLTQGPVLILGAGGAARALAASIWALGVPISVANRSRVRAEALAAEVPGIRIVDWEQRSEALRSHAMVVNTTPLGMAGYPELDMDLSRAQSTLVVADIVYAPLVTGLLRAARARGLRVVNGLGMLLHQARPGFAAWFGIDPSVDEELRQFVAADLIAE